VEHGVLELAQAPDGTIFFITGITGNTQQDQNYEMAVVALDDETGSLKFRIERPFPTFTHVATCNGSLGEWVDRFSKFENLRVDSTGVAVVMFHASQEEGSWGCGIDYDRLDVQARLYRIESSGMYDYVTLMDEHFDRFVTPNPDSYIRQTAMVPDAQGGVLAAWQLCDYTTKQSCALKGEYVNGLDAGTVMPLPVLPTISASGQMAYGTGPSGTTKLNMMTGEGIWTSPVAGVSLVSLDNDRVAVSDFSIDWTGTTILNSAGATETTGQPSAAWGIAGTYSPLEFAGSDWIARSPMAVTGATSWTDADAGYAFSVGGDEWGAGVARSIGRGIFVKGHEVGANYAHASIRIVPNDLTRWRHPRPNDPNCLNPTDGGCFSNIGVDGVWSWFATLGAGQSNDLEFLEKGINRTNDVQQEHVDLERLRYAALAENSIIAKLFATFALYRDDAPYGLFPEVYSPPQAWNSNSFISGFLSEAGLPLPAFPMSPSDPAIQYPGWVSPLPLVYFLP
jgi:hypothetical protein